LDFDALAVFSSPTSLDGRNFLQNALEFAQGKKFPGGGRFLLMADHSVFINSMLLPPPGYPNNNLEFTQNCLAWLMSGPEFTHRDKVLFISDGEIVTDFELVLREMPPESQEEVMKYMADHPEQVLQLLAESPEARALLWENRDKASPLLAAMEDAGVFSALGENDFFNQAVLNIVSLSTLIKTALFLATVGLLGYAATKFISSKWKVPKGVPRLALVLDRFRPRAGLLEQRLRDGVASGQYYEPARERARQLFADLDLIPAIEGTPPRYTIDASWFQRSRIDRELREIWAIAFGVEPVAVSGKQWAGFALRLSALRSWIHEGIVRFDA
jgi:hypothetical protein